jgi:CheY-like chemotaxis protein
MYANEKGINFNIMNYNENISIKSDRKRIKQILINLISNAIKFTDFGTVKFDYSIDGNNVVFKVTDTGLGIAETDQEIIFERFRQIENFNTKIHKGTGLGLSIVKAILIRMNGEIEVKSKINDGSTFIVTIPAESKITEVENNSKSLLTENPEFNWSEKTVLIVEDEMNNYILLEKLLKRTNIKIEYAANRKNTMSKIMSKLPDIVLLDIKLENESGYDIVKIIKDYNASIPVIAQTAYALNEDIEFGKKIGFDDYLSKPILKEKLINAMARFLNK